MDDRLVKINTIPNSDQINTIKPLNRRKHEERDVEIQASISPSLLNKISTSSASWMRKWVLERMESRDSRREVSKQINCLISNLNAYK